MRLVEESVFSTSYLHNSYQKPLAFSIPMESGYWKIDMSNLLLLTVYEFDSFYRLQGFNFEDKKYG